MAKIRRGVQTEQPGLVFVTGSYGTNGGSALDAATNRGSGWSVLRTGVGVHEITFNEKYAELVSFVPGAQFAAAADTLVQAGAYTAPTSTAKGKIVVRTYDPNTGAGTGAAVDVAADANNRVNFVACFRNTLVKV